SAALAGLATALQPFRESSPGLDACHARAVDAAGRLERWAAPGPATPMPGPGEPDTGSHDGERDSVRWYELTRRGFRLQRTPLDVSEPLRRHREESRAAWGFTSATLAVEGRFEPYAPRLGLDAAET